MESSTMGLYPQAPGQAAHTVSLPRRAPAGNRAESRTSPPCKKWGENGGNVTVNHPTNCGEMSCSQL